MKFTKVLLSVALLAAAGCDSFGPKSLVGIYDATTFTVADGAGSPVNVLAAGGRIHLIIADDLTTGGTLEIPAGVSGGPFSAGLLGEAVLLEGVVTIQTTAPTFIRNATWAYDDNSLRTTYVTGNTTVVVTLTKE